MTGYDMAVALPGLQNSVEGDEELFKVRPGLGSGKTCYLSSRAWCPHSGGGRFYL